MSSTERSDVVTQLAQAVKDAREAKQLTLRDFGIELGVSHNLIALWEAGERDITHDRIAAWLSDNRDWVRQLGVMTFSIKFGPMMANLAAGKTPPSAA